MAGLTLREDPGACHWDADAEELADAGSLTNSTSNDPGPVEVEVTWVDSTGELDSWSDLVLVGPNATEHWDISTGALDPPQGLSCRVRLVP